MSTTLSDAKARKNRNVRLTILTTGAIFILLMTYGSGMRAQKRQLDKMNEERKGYKQELRLTQMELRVRDGSVQQLEARRQISIALSAIEKGDTITAQKAVADAQTRLQTAQSEDANTLPDFAKIVETLSSLPMNRAAIQSIADQMDAALTTVAPKADFLSKMTVAPPNANDVPQTPATPGNDVTRTE